MTKRKLTAAENAAYRELARAAAKLRRAQEAAERKQLKTFTPSVPTDQQHTAQQLQEPAGSSPNASSLGSAAASGVVPELLTTKQAAALVGCGERTFWAWSRSGLAPAPLKIGLGLRPAVRYRRTDIMAWIAAGCPRIDGRKHVAR
jgi:predicted DNA-binding transcriptional regulator AlpA